MPHISKRKVDQKVLNALFLNLVKSLTKVKNKKEAQFFLNDILTDTEKIMIGKRMTTIWLLHKKVSFTKIERVLKISQSTIHRISLNYKLDKYKNLIEILNKREKDFSNDLYKILHLGGLLRPYGVRWKK